MAMQKELEVGSWLSQAIPSLLSQPPREGAQRRETQQEED